MDYGRLDDVSGVDFYLPPNAPPTARTLAAAPPEPSLRVAVGCPIWNCPAWVGKWYPPTAQPKEFLTHYVRQFNTIELNVTHYQIPTEATVRRWAGAAPAGFTYCPKWPQAISHAPDPAACGTLAADYAAAVLRLGECLGTTFLQLPPTFGPDRTDTLYRLLDAVPADLPVAVEFRHPAWFDRPSGVWDALAERGVGTVLADTAGRRDALHMRLTIPTATVRFLGNGLHATDFSRVDDWVQRFKGWRKAGLRQLFFFVHQPENLRSPDLVSYAVQALGGHGLRGATLPQPVRSTSAQTSLF